MAEPRYETIRPRTQWLGKRLIHLAATTSTMDEARRLAAEGAASGTVVVADVQTAGRGRAERAWHSPTGSLYATILVRDEVPLASLPLVSLAAGLAVARSIEKLLRLRPRLKWPNDVWIGAKKVAGVLIETRLQTERAEFVLIGLGVNGNLREDDFATELRAIATSLSLEAHRHVCLPALLKILLEDLDASLAALRRGAAEELLDAGRSYSMLMGKRVRVQTSEGTVEGTASALGPLGELILQTEAGPRSIHAGDCQLLRPI